MMLLNYTQTNMNHMNAPNHHFLGVMGYKLRNLLEIPGTTHKITRCNNAKMQHSNAE
jgi:hypothetical protein